MANKKEFHFDFNEDAEPVEELHRRRVAMMKHFKTLKAVMEYIDSQPLPEGFSFWEGDGEKKSSPKAAARRSVKPAAKPRGKRTTSKRPAHA